MSLWRLSSSFLANLLKDTDEHGLPDLLFHLKVMDRPHGIGLPLFLGNEHKDSSESVRTRRDQQARVHRVEVDSRTLIAFIAPAISKGSRGRSVGNKQFEPKSTFKPQQVEPRNHGKNRLTPNFPPDSCFWSNFFQSKNKKWKKCHCMQNKIFSYRTYTFKRRIAHLRGLLQVWHSIISLSASNVETLYLMRFFCDYAGMRSAHHCLSLWNAPFQSRIVYIMLSCRKLVVLQSPKVPLAFGYSCMA